MPQRSRRAGGTRRVSNAAESTPHARAAHRPSPGWRTTRAQVFLSQGGSAAWRQAGRRRADRLTSERAREPNSDRHTPCGTLRARVCLLSDSRSCAFAPGRAQDSIETDSIYRAPIINTCYEVTASTLAGVPRAASVLAGDLRAALTPADDSLAASPRSPATVGAPRRAGGRMRGVGAVLPARACDLARDPAHACDLARSRACMRSRAIPSVTDVMTPSL